MAYFQLMLVCISIVLVDCQMTYIGTDGVRYVITNPTIIKRLQDSGEIMLECNGTGIAVNWLIDGQSQNSFYVKDRDILFNNTATDITVTSWITLPTSPENNNTVVTCFIIHHQDYSTTRYPSVTMMIMPRAPRYVDVAVLKGPDIVSSINITWSAVLGICTYEIAEGAPFSLGILPRNVSCTLENCAYLINIEPENKNFNMCVTAYGTTCSELISYLDNKIMMFIL
jgi:hypothetical protein